MEKRKRYSPELRERAVRMVLAEESEYGSQWQAITLHIPEHVDQ